MKRKKVGYRKFPIKGLLFCVFYIVFWTLPTVQPLPEEYGTVNNPNSDTIWYRGETETIEWTWTTNCSSDIARIRWLIIFINPNITMSLKYEEFNIPNTGEYIWDIPLDFGEDEIEWNVEWYKSQLGYEFDAIRWKIIIYCGSTIQGNAFHSENFEIIDGTVPSIDSVGYIRITITLLALSVVFFYILKSKRMKIYI